MVSLINCPLPSVSAKYPQGSRFNQNIQNTSHFLRFTVYMYRVRIFPFDTDLLSRNDFNIFRLIRCFIKEMEYHHWDRIQRELVDNTDVQHTVGYRSLWCHVSIIAVLGRVGYTDHERLPLDHLAVDIQQIPLRLIR